MMIKPVLSILAVFILLLSPSASLTELTYKETEKVALNVSAFDPDKDALSISYGKPLDKRGEWQTDYGDAGIYHFNITVSDGDLANSEEVEIVVNRKEEPPLVTSSRPSPSSLSIDEGKTLSFSISAKDLNKDPLDYVWTLDGRNISDGKQIAYSPSYAEQGSHLLEAHITDGFSTTIRRWEIMVNDVDLDALIMGKIEDATVHEGDPVRLALPDFRYYGLSHTISPPLESNFWQTDYNSSGTYKVDVHVFGSGFDKKKTIRLRVQNVDRPPMVDSIAPQVAIEGKPFSLVFHATDPDGDALSYALETNLDGMVFKGGFFNWTPGFDEVLSTGLGAGIPRNFHLLSKVIELRASARSNNLTTAITVPVTIFNANRPPMLKDISPLTLKEGETFSFDAAATDPDNDSLSFSYESPLRRGERIPYDAAGRYIIKVTVSDGFLEDSRYVPVTITDANRAPELQLPRITARENQAFNYRLSAADLDNDELSFTLHDAPQGMTLEGNTLKWTPPFVSRQQEYSVPISVFDGIASANGTLFITLSHQNRAPVIEGTSLERMSVKKGVPLLLAINAADPDGGILQYAWHFGSESYFGNMHKRTFSTRGEKTVVATASDGKETAEKTFIITVY
ncbi:MAG: hypothetical protein HY518_05395 [Candidatus Aenigmarchaeota archaeon]|nr:hypothetical protein [Candidatus Aenigmarchaeota archaeon]